VTLNFGAIINTVLQFIIVSFAVRLVKALTRLHVREEPVPAASPKL